jgi:pyruvate ferredoxin oxidoreductase alpha subunit
MDGFIISHSVETMQIEDDKPVRDFIGEHTPLNSLLDSENPVSWGALDLQDYYIEHRRGQLEAMNNAPSVIADVSKRFAAQFGRKYEMFESYRLDDAERVIVAINSVAGEIKEVIDELREQGEKVGLLKIRMFRPFPYAEIAKALSGCKIVTVMDRSTSMGAYGPLFGEISNALYNAEAKPLLYNRIYGLGGREMLLDDIKDVFAESKQYLESGKVEKIFNFLNVRGD